MSTCLEVDSVLKSFGDKIVLADIYLCCYPGDVMALFGRNGSGKSTLMNIIFGTQKGDRSFIRINGRIASGSAFRTGLIGYLPQHSFLPSYLTVVEAVCLYIPKEQRSFFLDDPLLNKIRDSKIRNTSTGERRYLEIKLILYGSSSYIMLDEPFNGLSPIFAEEVRLHIARSAQTRGILLCDHNFREVHKIANRILLLNQCNLREIKAKEELIPFGFF